MKRRFHIYIYFFIKLYLYIFIEREEIQRIKAANPEIPHREAFSTAAKNVSSISNETSK